MDYVIGIILLGIVLLIVGYFAKRKYYLNVDRLEAWKIEVMNRPVLDEVGKIKQLNMSGQAEQFFEEWRKTWDAIVTIDLPNVEEWLYDAEECVSKFRFKKAKEIFEKIEDTLTESEQKINQMVERINEIIGSEEKNREEILNLQELQKNLKKYLLAHHHVFGKAAKKLELLLSESAGKFTVFDEETQNGNYLIARDVVNQLREELNQLEVKMEQIPLLLNDCHEIPQQINELKAGMTEMQKEGYNLEHLGIDKELERLEKQLALFEKQIEETEISGTTTGVEEVKEDLDLVYDLLEKEVTSKKYVFENSPIIKQMLSLIDNKNRELLDVVENVRLNYHLAETDEALLEEMNNKISLLKKSSSVLLNDSEDITSAYSAIKDKLDEIKSDIIQIESDQATFSAMLGALRKDEMDAREKIKEIRKQLQEITRTVARSNVPGIPTKIEAKFQEASEAIQECIRFLDQIPLSMPTVRNNLSHAEESVKALHNEVVEMIENVYLIEKIIQYGNRYRTKYPMISEKLLLAEDAFRRLDYHTALEEAAAAVEAVEPGALKRIESLVGEDMNQLV